MGAVPCGARKGAYDQVLPMAYPRGDAPPPDADVAALRAKLGLADAAQIAVYLGNLGTQSDFDTLIAAAGLLAETHPDFRLVLAGSGPRADALAAVAAKAGNVIVPGWLEGAEVHALMHMASFGMIAYYPVPNFLRNVPNKFPEYLSGGLAVACGLGGEMGALVKATGCGFCYQPGDADDLAQKMDAVLKAPDKLRQMRAAALALHAERFDGASIYPATADFLEDVVRNHRQGAG